MRIICIIHRSYDILFPSKSFLLCCKYLYGILHLPGLTSYYCLRFSEIFFFSFHLQKCLVLLPRNTLNVFTAWLRVCLPATIIIYMQKSITWSKKVFLFQITVQSFIPPTENIKNKTLHTSYYNHRCLDKKMLPLKITQGEVQMECIYVIISLQVHRTVACRILGIYFKQ